MLTPGACLPVSPSFPYYLQPCLDRPSSSSPPLLALTFPVPTSFSQIKGFEKDKLTVCTLLFEGEAAEVAFHEKQIYEIAARHRGTATSTLFGDFQFKFRVRPGSIIPLAPCDMLYFMLMRC